MSHKSCSWARVDVRLPNARVVTFRDFEIKAPKSTCHMLTHRGITSIEALCQAAHLFECLYFYNHTLYRLAAFKQMVNLFSAIVFGSFFFSSPSKTLQAFKVSIINGPFSVRQLRFNDNVVHQVLSSSSMSIFMAFSSLMNALSLLFLLVFSMNLQQNLFLCQCGCDVRVCFYFFLAFWRVMQRFWAQARPWSKAIDVVWT